VERETGQYVIETGRRGSERCGEGKGKEGKSKKERGMGEKKEKQTDLVDENEGVNTETLEHPVRTRNGVVGEGKDGHEDRVGSEGDPVPERVVGGLSLREAALRLGLAGVDEVDELNTVLHEEDGNVVAAVWRRESRGREGEKGKSRGKVVSKSLNNEITQGSLHNVPISARRRLGKDVSTG
jgi:hypothetical protein